MQEQERYNRLIDTIETSLINLIRAIQGLEIMSSTLDQMYTCFLKNEVPDSWQAVSYASMLSLSEWYKDLKKRVNFVYSWMKNGHPSFYWLSGFFFPHGFMTGIL
jgi:dynein heavy chain